MSWKKNLPWNNWSLRQVTIPPLYIQSALLTSQIDEDYSLKVNLELCTDLSSTERLKDTGASHWFWFRWQRWSGNTVKVLEVPMFADLSRSHARSPLCLQRPPCGCLPCPFALHQASSTLSTAHLIRLRDSTELSCLPWCSLPSLFDSGWNLVSIPL